MTADDVLVRVDAVSARWRGERAERLGRTALVRDDFDELREAGILRLPVPVHSGGCWESDWSSLPAVAEVHRRLGAVDPSVALVSSMHPSVVAFWLCNPDPDQPAWEEQRAAVFASALQGRQWGTITSEPGSGGDIARTRTAAVPSSTEEAFVPGATYRLSGTKHFGSGSGIVDHMMTTAVADGDEGPMAFAIDVAGRPWDGTAGLQLIAPWDGVGMRATQSHGMRLDDLPAVRFAWDRPLDELTGRAAPLPLCLFIAVVLGIVDEAVALAREQIGVRAADLRAYEQVEWTRAERDHWLAVQAYEGALRAATSGDPAAATHAALRGKQAVAELAEDVLRRLTRVLGGGTFSARSPFSRWFEDVRALGFLRPPWPLADDSLFLTSLG